MKAVRYSTHLWALKNVTTGEYATEFDSYTGQQEVAVFTSRNEARFWAASNGLPLFQ